MTCCAGAPVCRKSRFFHHVPKAPFAVGEKKCAGPFSPQAFLAGVCFAAGDFFFACFYFFLKAFFVLISSSMLCLGLVSSFGIEYFTSFENSIETVAVFLCLRTKLASNSSKRERTSQ